jgi:hypothetical protein
MIQQLRRPEMKKQRQNRTAKADTEAAVSAPTKRGRKGKKLAASVVESLQQINCYELF